MSTLENVYTEFKFTQSSSFHRVPNMASQSIQQQLKYLVRGFVRIQLNNIRKDKDIQYEADLDKVIGEFLGNVLFKLDVVHEQHAKYVFADGTCINTKNYNGAYMSLRNFCVCSSTTFEGGTHEFQIKCIESGRDAVGIMSNTDICTFEHMWCADAPTNMYCLCGNGQLFTSYKTAGRNQDHSDLDGQCENGDIVKVVVDCDQWRVTFYKNGKAVGNPMNMVRDIPYHAFIAVQTPETEYKLLL